MTWPRINPWLWDPLHPRILGLPINPYALSQTSTLRMGARRRPEHRVKGENHHNTNPIYSFSARDPLSETAAGPRHTNPPTVRCPRPRIARPSGPETTRKDDPLAETTRGPVDFSVPGGRTGPPSASGPASPGWPAVIPGAPVIVMPSPAPGAGLARYSWAAARAAALSLVWRSWHPPEAEGR